MTLKRDALTRLCRARDMLREHAQPRTITEIARHADLSPWHFIRLFEAVFGATPNQFRMQARLDHARHLLALRDYSVTDVCMEVGFSSLGSFSDLFTRRIGVSPSKYRRQVRLTLLMPGRRERLFVPGCFSLMAGSAGLAIFEKHFDAALADSSRRSFSEART